MAFSIAFCAAVCSVFNCSSLSCRLFSSIHISSSFHLYACCFDLSASFCLFFASSSLKCSVYILCEFVAAFSKSFVIGTLLTPPHSSTAALLAQSPIIVSSFKSTFCFVSILLFVLNDLSTSAFEWHSDKAHFTIFGKTTKLSPLSYLLLNILCQYLSILSFKSSSVNFNSWYLTHSSPAITSSSGSMLGISLATTLQCCRELYSFCSFGFRHVKP